MIFIATIILLIFNLFSIAIAVSQKCNEITTSFLNESSNIKYSLIFDVEFDNIKNLNLITIKSIKSENLTNSSAPTDDLTLCYKQSLLFYMKCFDPSKSNNITAINGFISFTTLENYNTISLFYGFIDSGNIISYNGRIFSDENKCVSYNDKDYCKFIKNVVKKWEKKVIDYLTLGSLENLNSTLSSSKNLTTCCTSFKPVMKAPTNLPKCKNFKATSKIQNNGLSSTIVADFVLTDTSITAIGKYDNTNLGSLYTINSFQCQTYVFE